MSKDCGYSNSKADTQGSKLRELEAQNEELLTALKHLYEAGCKSSDIDVESMQAARLAIARAMPNGICALFADIANGRD